MSSANYEKVIDLWKAGKTQESYEYFLKMTPEGDWTKEEAEKLQKILPNWEEYLTEIFKGSSPSVKRKILRILKE